MVVDDSVLARIGSVWTKEGLFKSPWANIVGGWCIKYYRKYDRAPRKDVEGLFKTWAGEHAGDDDNIRMMEKFLGHLSGEYSKHKKELNPQYVVDRAAMLFNRNRLAKLKQELEDDVDNNDIEEAMKRVNAFGKIEIGAGSGIDVLRDMNAIKDAFEVQSEQLITWKGALGEFFGNAFERDGFIALTAPEKRGKSWWLQEIAWQGMLQRNKVAFFAVGDMSQRQMIRRFGTRAAKQPMRPKTIKYPKRIERVEDEPVASVTHEERVFKEGLSWQAIYKSFEMAIKETRSKQTLLKLSCFPNSTLSVQGLEGVLQQWERVDRWVPDLVVVDYADILAPPPGMMDSRDAINTTWKKLRSLSQQLHGCIVTATQADAASYTSNLIEQSNFSEDKRKWAHVTGGIGINQTPEEKSQGIYRLNWVVLRENEFDVRKCVYVASCLGIGNPAIRSTY